MHTIWIAYGSNQGDPIAQLLRARQNLATHLDERGASALYRTPPWGYTAQPDFINAVIRYRSDLAPLALLDLLQSVEQQQGRERPFKTHRAPSILTCLPTTTCTLTIRALPYHTPASANAPSSCVRLPILIPNCVLAGRPCAPTLPVAKTPTSSPSLIPTGKPQPLETTMHPEDDDYDDENFDREAELEREWQEMEDEENAEDYEDDWDNLERSGEDGWYYDDEGDERDNLDDYGYDDEYRDDD